MSIDQGIDHAAGGQPAFEQAAAVAAHEMAGPLTTAAAAIELLRWRLDPDDPQARDLVDTATRQLRVARLQTSRLAQLAAGAGTPRLAPTDLGQLAREVVGDLALTDLANHPTSVESDGPTEAPVDADQIRQTLYNLLSNAATYSPSGRDIVVELGQDAEHVWVRVRDQGHGVAPEAVDLIFQPYQRAHADAPGLGLGLALSRDIARRHGGELVLEPAPKGGAVFLLTLPRGTSPTA